MKYASLALFSILAVPAWLAAQTAVDERRPAAPDGTVEIENLSGTIKVTGWDQAEVWVTGTLAADAELGFEGSKNRTEIEVEFDGHPQGATSDLEVHVPAGSHVEIEAFQADIEVNGVNGTVEAETVNGGIVQSGAAREVSLQSVNGAVDVTGPSGRIQVEVVNGSITIQDASGDLEAATVNGQVIVAGGSYERTSLESVAGKVKFESGLSPQGRLDIETVSGSVEIFVAAGIQADFSIASFSGDIHNELGVGAIQEEEYTSAKELSFSTGPGGARISVETLSGAIHLRQR
jgi:DUF4097 and DUF4098 domain-containing protein YvlB